MSSGSQFHFICIQEYSIYYYYPVYSCVRENFIEKHFNIYWYHYYCFPVRFHYYCGVFFCFKNIFWKSNLEKNISVILLLVNILCTDKRKYIWIYNNNFSTGIFDYLIPKYFTQNIALVHVSIKHSISSRQGHMFFIKPYVLKLFHHYMLPTHCLHIFR